MGAAECNKVLGPGQQFGIGRRPVQPGDFVVLGIGVVVAVLGLAEFGAHRQHGRAARQQQGGEQGALVALAGGADRWVFAGAFGAVVPGKVGVGAVAVVLGVGLVVLVLVRNQIGQGEAVMRGDEVDAARRAPFGGEDILGAGEPGGEFGQGSTIATPETSGGVAEPVVPFTPMGREAAELVTAGANIPGFGDQLQIAQHGILGNRRQQRGCGVEPVRAAAERGGEVEAEPVHAAQIGPGAQRIHRQAQHLRMVQGQSVAGAAVVDVAGGIVRQPAVIAGIIQAAQRQSGAERIALPGMVQHDIDDGFNPGFGQRRDGGADFRPAAGRQARIGRHQRHRIVAPVIAQAAHGEMGFLNPGGGGQDFHRGDAEAAQMRDRFGMRQTGEPAAQFRRNGRMALGEAADMQFVEQRPRPGHQRLAG